MYRILKIQAHHKMYYLGTILWLMLHVAYLPGESQAGSIPCQIKMISELTAAGYGHEPTGADVDFLSAPIKLQYAHKDGTKKTIQLVLSEHCKEPEILCKGDKSEIAGGILAGPLVYCSWSWEKNGSVDNHVAIRLSKRPEKTPVMSMIGFVSANNENIFPQTIEKELLHFKVYVENGVASDSTNARKRREAETQAEDDEGGIDSSETYPLKSPVNRNQSTDQNAAEVKYRFEDIALRSHASTTLENAQFTKLAYFVWTIGIACVSLRMTN